MAIPILRGSAIPLLQDYEEHYDPETGYTRQYDWEGTVPAWVQQYAAQYQAAGCATSVTVKFGVGRLIVNDTTGEVTIDRWEIDAEQLSKSSLFNQRNLAHLNATELAVFYALARGETSSADAATALTGNDFALRLLDRINKGSTDFQFDGYVLRHTTNVSNRYQRNISDANKSCLYTNAQLLSEAQNSNLWLFPLPGRLVYKIQNIYSDAIAQSGVHDNFLWSWLKSASTERSAANQCVDICTLYKFDEWSTDEYATF